MIGYPNLATNAAILATNLGCTAKPRLIVYWYLKARSMHARNKQIASAIGIQLPIRLGRLNSLSPTPARLTRDHLAPDAALGLFWLVLACLACAALLRAPKSKKLFGA